VLDDPRVSVRASCPELGLDHLIVLSVNGKRTDKLHDLVTDLATAIARGEAADMRMTVETRGFEVGLQKRADLQKVQHQFYIEMHKSFEQIVTLFQKAKHDYYKEIDHLRNQLSNQQRHPEAKPADVIFFDPDAYRLPSWQEIADRIDVKRWGPKEGGDCTSTGQFVIPFKMLCARCKVRSSESQDSNSKIGEKQEQQEASTDQSTQTDSLDILEVHKKPFVTRWAQTEDAGVASGVSRWSQTEDAGSSALLANEVEASVRVSIGTQVGAAELSNSPLTSPSRVRRGATLLSPEAGQATARVGSATAISLQLNAAAHASPRLASTASPHPARGSADGGVGSSSTTTTTTNGTLASRALASDESQHPNEQKRSAAGRMASALAKLTRSASRRSITSATSGGDGENCEGCDNIDPVEATSTQEQQQKREHGRLRGSSSSFIGRGMGRALRAKIVGGGKSNASERKQLAAKMLERRLQAIQAHILRSALGRLRIAGRAAEDSMPLARMEREQPTLERDPRCLGSKGLASGSASPIPQRICSEEGGLSLRPSPAGSPRPNAGTHLVRKSAVPSAGTSHLGGKQVRLAVPSSGNCVERRRTASETSLAPLPQCGSQQGSPGIAVLGLDDWDPAAAAASSTSISGGALRGPPPRKLSVSGSPAARPARRSGGSAAASGQALSSSFGGGDGSCTTDRRGKPPFVCGNGDFDASDLGAMGNATAASASREPPRRPSKGEDLPACHLRDRGEDNCRKELSLPRIETTPTPPPGFPSLLAARPKRFPSTGGA